MVIHGFQKLTLLDYPGKVACTLFSGGCNFRCPFCQNGNLVQHPEWEPVIPEEEIFAVLEKRRGVLDGVCCVRCRAGTRGFSCSHHAYAGQLHRIRGT